MDRGAKTKDRILSETLAILGEEGAENLTVRNIIKRTGTNIGAINYHFGSKDKLIGKAITFFTGKIKDAFRELESGKEEPKAALRTFLERFSFLVATYPGFIRSVFGEIMKEKNDKRDRHPAFLNMQKGRQALLAIMKELRPDLDDETINICLLQMMSAVMASSLMGNLVQSLYEIDCSEENVRKRYIRLLIDKFLSFQTLQVRNQT